MKPYYEHAGITIYHGDWHEVLHHESRFDLLLTDPPYGIGKDGQAQSSGKHGGRKAYEFLGWDSETPSRQDFAELLRVCSIAIIWGGNYFADKLPATQRWFVWDKGQRINQSDGELAWTSMAGALRIFELNRCFIQGWHPTEKPVALMKWCMLQSGCDVSAKVLDPYMGSGSTLLAARALGQQALGIDREERFCEIAAKRLSQEVLF